MPYGSYWVKNLVVIIMYSMCMSYNFCKAVAKVEWLEMHIKFYRPIILTRVANPHEYGLKYRIYPNRSPGVYFL